MGRVMILGQGYQRRTDHFLEIWNTEFLHIFPGASRRQCGGRSVSRFFRLQRTQFIVFIFFSTKNQTVVAFHPRFYLKGKSNVLTEEFYSKHIDVLKFGAGYLSKTGDKVSLRMGTQNPLMHIPLCFGEILCFGRSYTGHEYSSQMGLKCC